MKTVFDFGKTLRTLRVSAKKNVSEVSQYLTALGFKANEKTIYSWENNRSQPTPSAFLYLCDFYDVTDILGAFGYRTPNTIQLSGEHQRLVNNFDALNKEGQEKLLEYAEDISDMEKYKKSYKLSLDSKEA